MKTLGFAMTGSFCTFEKATAQLEALSHTYHILPLMSQNAYTTDTRFGKAADWVRRVEEHQVIVAHLAQLGAFAVGALGGGVGADAVAFGTV